MIKKWGGLMGHEFRKPELPLCQVLVLVLISMLSCGHDRGTDLSAPVGQSNSGIMNDQSGYGAIEQIQPGIHESSAFFPVEPDRKSVV